MNTVIINYTSIILFSILPFSISESYYEVNLQNKSFEQEVERALKSVILEEAKWALGEEPVTITSSTAERSSGNKHDFYSEGDYWWPDPEYPEGPYIQRDGMTNPDNFVDHRLALIRFSRIIGALASAYKISGEQKYVSHAFNHLNAWFLDAETYMNPSLKYAQAISGRVTGRGIGIIDTIHLMEVAQGVMVLQEAGGADKQQVEGIKEWFSQYIQWLTNHQYGIDEMNAKNNHGTCWVMQVAAFARLTKNEEVLDFCRERYKTLLLPNQMGEDGSFPLELARTKPYGYSLFNLDAITMVVHILSDKQNNLWAYETADGRSIKKGIEFLYPYLKKKDNWPFQKDVMYWDEWPVAHPFLIFGAEAYQQKEWFKTWQNLDHQPEVPEVVRNLPVRHPLIWFK